MPLADLALSALRLELVLLVDWVLSVLWLELALPLEWVLLALRSAFVLLAD